MNNLRQNFQHAQWGSIIGQENDIRLAALKDEVEVWQERTDDGPTYPYGYVSDMLKNRIKELEKK